jgi:hypothetical protein
MVALCAAPGYVLKIRPLPRDVWAADPERRQDKALQGRVQAEPAMASINWLTTR